MKKATAILLSMIIFAAVVACEKKEAAPAGPLTPEQLVAKGRSIYVANCLACHNADPGVDGSVGPATKGASLELLEARVINGVYPAGYTPKRATNVMQKFPQLKEHIPALHAYLSQ